MNIVVLVKMVPDTESRLEIVDGKVNESGFKYMVNPYDEFAVEQAVQFKEASGGKVTLVSLFSNDKSIDTDLRKMMAIGADEAIVLRQDGYRGDRPSANAKTISDAAAMPVPPPKQPPCIKDIVGLGKRVKPLMASAVFFDIS